MSWRRWLAALLMLAAVTAAGSGASTRVQRDVEATNVANSQPAWSPDGRSIAYVNSSNGRTRIVSIDAAGRRTRTITLTRGFRPVWIPHSDRIAYETNDGGTYDVAVVDVHGLHPVPLLSGVGSAAWSRNGRRIVFDRPDSRIPQSQILIADANGRHERVVVRNANMDGAEPTWSPDGSRIAFVGGSNTGAAFIDVVGADGRHRIRITRGGKEHSPAWSPDGTRIAFTVEGSRSRIGIVDADGTGEHVLRPAGGWDDAKPVWSPDGRLIAFGSTRTGNWEIWAMHPDGTHLRRLTYGGCTIIGTPGNDVLVGTPGRDVICGLGGDDTIFGRGGDDKLLGGAGDDRLYGGAGDDTIFGQAGNDLLVAGPGSNRLDGGGGDDTILARNGTHDRIEGGPGRDRALGDRADFAYDVELGNLADHRHPPPLSRAQITARTAAAVRRSRAQLVSLVVVAPGIRYALVVRVPDPARYLQHRASMLVDAMNKVTFNRRVQFKRIRFAVEDSSGKTVLSWAQTRGHESAAISFDVDPRYAGCISGLALEHGDTADETLPPCPAR